MRRLAILLSLCLFAALSISTPAAARQGRDDPFEQQVLDRLAQIDPAAVPIFQQATADMDAERLDAAKRGFEQVLKLAPGFPDAERRLSYVEGALGNAQAAVDHAQRALAGDDSPYNHSALARSLLNLKDSTRLKEALTEAQTAVRQLPDDASVQLVLLYAAIENNHHALIDQASQALVRLAPDNPLGHYFVGIVAANNGQFEQAEAELLLAKAKGLDAAEVQRVLDGGVSQEANKQRALRLAVTFMIGWAVTGVVLFVTGLLLSRLTLIAVRRPPTADALTGAVHRGPRLPERLMRGVYRLVIVLTSLYFYLSIPVVCVVVLGGAAIIVWLILAGGVISVYIVAALVLIPLTALLTVYVLIRGVFTRRKEDEPGRALTRAEAPPLWALTESVAQAVNTRPIEAIYVTPGVEVGVSERGSLMKKLRGAGQRRLILGLGALPDMTQSQFQAILAHEYGHFLNRDTAGGNLAQQVRGSVYRLVTGLAGSGQAVWYNPAWLFLNGFYRLFFRLTEGASRLQEIMADRQAALTYGVQNFIDGLLHIVKRDVLFQWQVNAEVERTAQPIGPLSNLYTLPRPEAGDARQTIDTAFEKIVQRPTSPYDSHPGVQERVDLVKQLAAASPLGLGSSRPVWDLIPNAPELQQAMTNVIQRNVDAARNKQSPAKQLPPTKTIEEPPTPIESDAAKEDWECDACGALVPATASFCPKCGAAFTN